MINRSDMKLFMDAQDFFRRSFYFFNRRFGCNPRGGAAVGDLKNESVISIRNNYERFGTIVNCFARNLDFF